MADNISTMLKRKSENSIGNAPKRGKFNLDWLLSFAVETEMPEHGNKSVILGEIFSFSETRGVICKICTKAK